MTDFKLGDIAYFIMKADFHIIVIENFDTIDPDTAKTVYLANKSGAKTSTANTAGATAITNTGAANASGPGHEQ